MRIVLDPPLPDAFIIFEDIATGRLYTAKTDSEGRASLYLPQSIYNLWVFREGYSTYKATVNVNKDLTISVTLEVAGVPTEKRLDPAKLARVLPSLLEPHFPEDYKSKFKYGLLWTILNARMDDYDSYYASFPTTLVDVDVDFSEQVERIRKFDMWNQKVCKVENSKQVCDSETLNDYFTVFYNYLGNSVMAAVYLTYLRLQQFIGYKNKNVDEVLSAYIVATRVKFHALTTLRALGADLGIIYLYYPNRMGGAVEEIKLITVDETLTLKVIDSSGTEVVSESVLDLELDKWYTLVLYCAVDPSVSPKELYVYAVVLDDDANMLATTSTKVNESQLHVTYLSGALCPFGVDEVSLALRTGEIDWWLFGSDAPW